MNLMTSQPQKSSSPPCRRSFLKAFILAAAGLLALMWGWGVARFSLYSDAKNRARELDSQFVANLKPGVPTHSQEAGAWVTLKSQDGPLEALDDRCTHLGCRQYWDPARKVFHCPCHGSEFDAEGRVLRGPATRPLPKLTAEKDDQGQVRLLEASS